MSKYAQVLMFLGPTALREAVENAELYPIRGLFNFRDYFIEIDDYYNRTLGYDCGVSTGWRALDGLYKVRIIFFFPSFHFFKPLFLSLIMKNTGWYYVHMLYWDINIVFPPSHNFFHLSFFLVFPKLLSTFFFSHYGYHINWLL